MKWDAFYAGKGMNGSSLNSREYHQMMYILKRMGTEVVERSVEIALEIASQSFSNFIDIIQNMFNKDDMNLMQFNENKE